MPALRGGTRSTDLPPRSLKRRSTTVAATVTDGGTPSKVSKVQSSSSRTSTTPVKVRTAEVKSRRRVSAAGQSSLVQHVAVSAARKRNQTVTPRTVSLATPSDSKVSPMKTRRLQKTKDSTPRCTLCRKSKGELKSCHRCALNFHLHKCLLMSEEVAKIAEHKRDWLCPKCIRCTGCSMVIDDVHNRECRLCLRAWHGACAKGAGGPNHWTCAKCAKNSPKTADHHLNKSPAKTSIAFGGSPSVSAPATLDSAGNAEIVPKRGRGRPKGSTLKRLQEQRLAAAGNHLELDLAPPPLDETSEAILTARNEVWDELVEHQARFESPTKRGSRSPRKGNKNSSRSPEKRASFGYGAAPPLPPPPKKLATVEDLDIFIAAERQLQEEIAASESEKVQAGAAEARASTNTTTGKWVYMGSEKMKALYASPYTEDVLRADRIFVCSFCLYPTGDKDVYRIHQSNCPFQYPPGNEIYRDDGISFFEVDGAVQRTYCRNLCLLSKMFISSKTLHHEVDTFLFYILTEITPSGCRIVGYFSKEKNPSKNNNLSCLLTLPSERRRGYGRLLIDMSYELSRLERKVGSPEHPLSDLGLFTYRDFWRSSILCYLRSVRNSPHTSIKHMALSTRIHPTDIVNQLMRDKLLLYKDGNYFVKTGKRAYKWPLSVCRRRCVDREKLIWKPDFDVTQLDPSKINYYV